MTCETAKTQDHQFLLVPPANFQPSKFWFAVGRFFLPKTLDFFKKVCLRALFNFFTSKLTYLLLIHETLLLGSFLHYFEVFVVFELVQRGEEGRFVSLCISVCQLISQVSLDVNHIPSHVCFRKALNIAHLCSKVKIFFYWASRSKQVDTYFH